MMFFPLPIAGWIALVSFALSPVGAQAQSGAAPAALQDVAQLSASGSVEVQQDLLTITLATTREGADPALVQAQLRQALDGALAAAKTAALPGQMEVRTGNFGLFPRYAQGGKINGWQGSAELVLEGRDFARITATAGKIQNMTIGSVGFALSPEQRVRLEAQAQSLAIAQFKIKAGEVARAFGFATFTLREVAVNASDAGSPPRPRNMAAQARGESAEAGIPVEAGKITVLVSVSGSVQMK